MEKNAFIGAAVALTVATAAWAGGAAEETRDVPSFTEVALKGSVDVDIVVGKDRSVRVVADDDIIEHIETEVNNGRLEVKLDNHSHRNIKKMHVYVTVPSLEAAAIYGSGDMKITGGIDGDFEFDIYGSGDASIDDLNVQELDLSIKGSGDLEIDGTCGSLDVSIKGSGNVEGRGLKCSDVEASIMGSGDVAIHASEKIDATVKGSGDIDVYGNPDKVRTRVRGSGDINMH